MRIIIINISILLTYSLSSTFKRINKLSSFSDEKACDIVPADSEGLTTTASTQFPNLKLLYFFPICN